MRSMDEFVRVKEAAEILGVAANTIRTWGADGRIPEYRHPVNNYRFYKRSDLDDVLRRLTKSATRKRNTK